jgi:endonuclease YncB( thermonuclease family)
MIFGIIAIIAASIGVLYFTVGSLGANRVVEVSVTRILDGNTVEVRSESGTNRVVLGGIGFPLGDERAARDSFEALEDVANGRRFKMEVLKETDGLSYVELKTAIGDSLNRLLLEKGLARFDSRAIGLSNAMMEAESKARAAKLGIWDRNRELFRQAANSHASSDALEGGARTIDQVEEEPLSDFVARAD